METQIRELLRDTPPGQLQTVLTRLTEEELVGLERELRGGVEERWLPYRHDPVGFITEGLGEAVWSKQVEILESLRDNKRTAVPACHAPGKSHIAARAIAWWVAVHPTATTRVVTTATTYRQVKNILWSHIRRIVAEHDLQGEVFTTEWKISNDIVADGFSPADHNEAAVQGIHAENLLIVVDEAGGISNTIGQALEALMTGGHTRLLLLGNPPTDNMGSWFERSCTGGLYNVIPISAYDTPNFTGENIGPWSRNLVDQTWVDDVKRSFGEDSPFVQARVYARFPRSVNNATIPIDWLERAAADDHEPGTVKLGVDIAAEGGDEFAIAQMDGDHGTLLHASSSNPSPVEVAGVVLEHIHKATRLHEQRGIHKPVRVKLDAIGIGWGVCGILEEWGKEGRHSGKIVPVNVSHRPHEDRFANQRAELWWTMRERLQPDEHGQQSMTLNIDHKTLQQLAAPMYRSNSSGKIIIEGKEEMKRRGLSSPDRAEALLLALYEPPGSMKPDLAAPLSIPQGNAWF